MTGESQRADARQGAGAGEQPAEEARSRAELAQADPLGRAAAKALKPARKRELLWELLEDYEISERRACRLLVLHWLVCRYESRKKDDRALRMRLKELTYSRPRYGLPGADRVAVAGRVACEPQAHLPDLRRGRALGADEAPQEAGRSEAAAATACGRAGGALEHRLHERSAGRWAALPVLTAIDPGKPGVRMPRGGSAAACRGSDGSAGRRDVGVQSTLRWLPVTTGPSSPATTSINGRTEEGSSWTSSRQDDRWTTG